MEGEQPPTVGYGITSDPIRDLSYDSLFAAVDISIKEPWRVLDVDQTGCSFEDCAGYTLRRMKLKKTGENVVERVTINEETGTVSYNKCDASANPETWSVCSPSTRRSAWNSTSAASPAACASTGRHRTAWQRTPSRTLCSWPRRLRAAPPTPWGTAWPPSLSPT